MSYTVTEKGTVTIPAEIRRKLGLTKGSHVEFVQTDEGVLLVPVIRLEALKGIDRDKKDVIRSMIREIQEERGRESFEE